MATTSGPENLPGPLAFRLPGETTKPMTISERWLDFLNPTDLEVIRRGGYGKRRGSGTSPALMIIDPQYNYAGDDRPILEQIEHWPSGVGEAAWRAVENIQGVLEAVRRKNAPVIYTRHVQRDLFFDGFAAKAERDGAQYLLGARGTQIVEALTPCDGDLVIDKSYASAFYGTPLESFLIKLKVDTLIVTGGTTSGCVRAFCVDAVSRNYHTVVLADCVFDRISVSHAAALLDLWMKYCDVIECSEIMTYLKGL